jgi:hypothetical protein
VGSIEPEGIQRGSITSQRSSSATANHSSKERQPFNADGFVGDESPGEELLFIAASVSMIATS